MKRRESFFLLFALLLLMLLYVVAGSEQGNFSIRKSAKFAMPNDAWSATRVLVPLTDLSSERVALGAQLFADRRLSADGSLACNSCHDLRRGGADGRPVSIGVNEAKGTINAPTVFNAAYSFVQFWDGRARTLEEQVAGPIHNPLEMATDWNAVVARLGADAVMREAFLRAYPEGLNARNIADAIATYERTLITLNSRFDRFQAGDQLALSPLEREGYQRFMDLGCVSCHQGMLLGGNMFQRFGVLQDYFAGRTLTRADLGRFNVTGLEKDKHVFKVPGLRNVALTAPYFHDASAETLELAVEVMGRYQLGKTLSHEEIRAIVAFLKTLTGEVVQ